MVSEDDYCSMKSKVPEIKRLFQQEHYVRCVAYGEHLLLPYDEQIHPIHLLYIHFYIAMAHSVMAREATGARRCFELNRAEKHYLLAIASLNSQISDAVPPPYYPYPFSPTRSEDDYDQRSRRASDASQQSFASSATSVSEGHYEIALTKPSHQHTTSLTRYSPPTQKLPEAHLTSQASFSDQEWVFLADLSLFRGVVRDHLRQVVELKQAMVPPSVQPTHTHSRTQSQPHTHLRSNSSISFIPNTTVTHSRTHSTPAFHSNRSMARFAGRCAIPSRPRFDPTSVQKLCGEALFELRR